jgi:dynein heavy chain
LQGIVWIKEKEKQNNLQITRLGKHGMTNVIEMAIENGYAVLIENMDEQVDAILGPVIARNYIRRGKNKILKFGGKDLQLSDKFRLFMHTKLANPHYPPEIQAEATLINFTVTEDGLGDQLLTLVVGKERPDLAKMKIELIQQQNEFKIKLKELEDGLLFKLANAQGDILADIELIENLETSKRISVEIKEKVAIAQVTEVKINEASEAYRAVASRGALIFFLMNDLNKIHTFYMYSLESFVIVIKRAIDALGLEDKKNFTAKATEAIAEGGDKPADAKPEEHKEGAEPGSPEKKAEGADKPIEAAVALSPRSLNKRVDRLTESVTYVSFSYIRRGLFERHKLIVASMLCLRIQQRMGKLSADEVNHLVTGKIELKVPPIPDPVRSFINDQMWMGCVALEQIPALQGFLASLESDSLQWKKWYGEERAESSDLPKQFKELPKFYRLLLLRAMRQDRISSALYLYVAETMGERYVEQQPFSMEETFKETSAITPIFFVLFPGVDPTPDVEKIGVIHDITSSNGKFVNISMGQGQENRARDAIAKAAKDGTWIMLQNVHLMENWLKLFESYLEKAAESCKGDSTYRCFISSEPPGLPSMKIIPESILQNCVKVANEAPQDLKANLRRAYAKFNEEKIHKSTKPNEFKAILFGLCMFHSLVSGRKKFGSQGWSRNYNFNDGDLTICADVLHNYLERYDVVPYDDLRYIYGEIMYGGHITDNWDRRTCNTYLRVLIRPEILTKDFNLTQGFKSPDPSRFDYEAYRKYIEEKLPQESPQMFGMHPNAEIGYLTTMCETIFSTIVDVQGGGSSGGGKKDDGVMGILTDLKNRLPKSYNMLDVVGRIKEKNPYIVVCLQECERMNGLLFEIERSLKELEMGLQGALNITDAMEGLSRSLQLNRVPEVWEKNAYPSRKTLAPWFIDLIDRTNQLHEWSKEMVIPKSLCIAFLFNPMSFLTAIMQVTARLKGLPLDDMVLQTNVTTMKDASEVVVYAENGFFCHGLWLEGAAWELGAAGNEGYLTDAKLKELHPKLPVVNVIAVTKKEKKSIAQYQSPCYVTSGRGPTYVFTANLQMESEDTDPNKWVLAGVALLMSDD